MWWRSWFIRIKLAWSASKFFLFNSILKDVPMVLSLLIDASFFFTSILNLIIPLLFLLSPISLHKLLFPLLIHRYGIYFLTRFHLFDVMTSLFATLLHAFFDSVGWPIKCIIHDITGSVSHVAYSFMCFSTFWTCIVITFIILFNNDLGFLFWNLFQCAVFAVLFDMLRVSHLLQKFWFLFLIIFFYDLRKLPDILNFLHFLRGDCIRRTITHIWVSFTEKECLLWGLIFIWFHWFNITLLLRCRFRKFGVRVFFVFLHDNSSSSCILLYFCIILCLLIRIWGTQWSLSSWTRIHLIAKVKLVFLIIIFWLKHKQASLTWVNRVMTIGFFDKFSISSHSFRSITSLRSLLRIHGLLLSLQSSWHFGLFWL